MRRAMIAALTTRLSAPRPGNRRRRTRRQAAALLSSAGCAVASAAVLITATAVALRGAPPWRASGFALLLAVVVLVVESRPVSARTGDVAERDGRREALPVSWGFCVALVALGPLSLALVVCAVPVLHREVRRGARWCVVVVHLATSVVGILVCRLVVDAVLGAGGDHGEALRAPGQWPAVLAGGVVGLAAQFLAASVGRRVLDRTSGRAPHTGALSGVLLTLAVLASAPVVAVSAEGGAWLLLLACVPLTVLLLEVALARRHERRTTVDDLTGLPNRESLLASTARELRAVPASGPGPGLLVVDLDHFKDVNDTLGHPVGDALLREVAGRLRAQAAAQAVVARLGGDEFGLLVTDGARAEQLAEAVVVQMSRPLRVGNLHVLLPASVGVALAPAHGSSADSLLQAADVALYQAKEVRSRACTYTAHRDGHSVERLRLLSDLSRALDEGELFVRYQPQVDPRTGVVVGAEALARWHHPDLGAISPDRFIPLAEQSGLVTRVTTAVLDQALDDAARWQAEGFSPRVSVNLSARLLADAELPALVAAALRRHGVAATTLVLEVTETGIVSDPERAGAVVRGLRAMGCGVAVDDYGTGQCSLTYLTDLDVDELKIDRSFVTGMTVDRARGVIVRSTIQMARELGLRVVAEGVADAPTQRALADLGCHTAQGEFVGQPMTADGLLQWLRRQDAQADPVPVAAPLALDG